MTVPAAGHGMMGAPERGATMADQPDQHGDDRYVEPKSWGDPEKLSDVVRDVSKGVAEFLEGEPLVGEEGEEGEGTVEGGQLAP
jgi:hypothetical protein